MDPEQIYQEVLQEEQKKGSSGPVAEGRAKAARVRAEQGSPHPKEPKWWPGAQPHLEGDGSAPAEEEPEAEETPAEEEPATEEAPAEPEVAEAPQPAEAPAAAAAPSGTEQAAAQATEEPSPDAATHAGGAAPPPQPAAEPAAAAAVAAPQPAAAEAAPRPSGVSHGTTTGTRLRPEDGVATEAQFAGQQALYRRRAIVDELVASGVPEVAASDSAAPRGGSWALALLYILIPVLAIMVIAQQQDAGGGPPPPPGSTPGGNGGTTSTVTASSSQFDTDTIRLPAGEETTIEFVNEDTLQHNIAILPTGGGEALFTGEIITASSIDYDIPALDAGTYAFRCDVHPDMNGEVVVE